jgi:hexosaminidase
MIDTGRHFQPVASIKRLVDSLPYAKMNVLHWHMSDSQSFALESRAWPKLWQGSFSPQERYLQSEVADIVEYARSRAVRVMVEFDMPVSNVASFAACCIPCFRHDADRALNLRQGHAAAWCKGYPEVCPSPTCLQPLNVASNQTFTMVTDLLNEMTGGKPNTGLFPDSMIHLGGDEVNTACWTSTPAVTAWLKVKNMTANDAYGYFATKVADIAIQQGRRPVQWGAVFTHFGSQLDKRSIVHVWSVRGVMRTATAAGFDYPRAILSFRRPVLNFIRVSPYKIY